MQFTFDANHEQDTDRFGAALASVLPAGAVVALVGTLGAGKTRLAQAVAKAVGVDPREVVSPTFVLVHEYHVRVQDSGFRVQGVCSDHQAPVSTIYHLDAYRIRDDDEFRELGPEEYFESNGWTFIEWADRVRNCLPSEYLQIEIEVTGSTMRRFHISPHGSSMEAACDNLRSKFAPQPLNPACPPWRGELPFISSTELEAICIAIAHHNPHYDTGRGRSKVVFMREKRLRYLRCT
jgi:tRNA threonylcarbamoyladenosine biosynthesis protein TsaE